MKNIFLKAIVLFGVFAFLSCHQKTNNKSEITANQEVEQIETETETIVKTVEGKVVEINNGKDGYTAKIETAEKEFYFVTISHANLKDHKQYKSVTIGETLKVTGDFWKMEGVNQITVRSID